MKEILNNMEKKYQEITSKKYVQLGIKIIALIYVYINLFYLSYIAINNIMDGESLIINIILLLFYLLLLLFSYFIDIIGIVIYLLIIEILI